MEMDLKDFFTHFYTLMNEMVFDASVNGPIYLRVLELMFVGHKIVNLERTAAFVKKMSSLCPYVPTEICIGLLFVIHTILTVIYCLIDTSRKCHEHSKCWIQKPWELDCTCQNLKNLNIATLYLRHLLS